MNLPIRSYPVLKVNRVRRFGDNSEIYNVELSVPDILKGYHIGKIIYHKTLKNKNGTPLRARVNGKIKTWVRNNNFRIPMKYGLRECFYINESNWMDWVIE